MYANTCFSSQCNVLVINPGTFSSKTFYAFENSYSEYAFAGVAKIFLAKLLLIVLKLNLKQFFTYFVSIFKSSWRTCVLPTL